MIFEIKKYNSASGFTIMEAMVTVGIIAIMSAVYFTGYRTNNQKIILDQAAAVMVSDLRLAQSMAMNVRDFNGEVPLGGYGINTSGVSSYVIYADCNNSHDYQSSGLLCASGAATEKYTDRSLAANINIISPSLSDITFTPPFASIWINGAQALASSTITLQYGGSGGPVKTITINRLTGQISTN